MKSIRKLYEASDMASRRVEMMLSDVNVDDSDRKYLVRVATEALDAVEHGRDMQFTDISNDRYPVESAQRATDVAVAFFDWYMDGKPHTGEAELKRFFNILQRHLGDIIG